MRGDLFCRQSTGLVSYALRHRGVVGLTLGSWTVRS